MNAVEQVCAKRPLSNGGLEVGVGGSDQSNVHCDGLGSSDTIDHTVLQHSEQLRLGFQRHFTDLVQEQGAGVGQFKSPGSS